MNWLISKDNGDSETYTEYTDFVLNEYGGDIQLLNSGEYALTLSPLIQQVVSLNIQEI